MRKEEHYLDAISLTQEEYEKVFLIVKEMREEALDNAVVNLIGCDYDALTILKITTSIVNDIAEEKDDWEIEEDEE